MEMFTGDRFATNYVAHHLFSSVKIGFLREVH